MSTAQSVETTPHAGTYTIDPQVSQIRFTTKHLFGTGKVEGTFSDASGTIVIADPVSESTLVASAAAGSFKTSDRRRDEKVKSAKLLHADKHPRIMFKSTGVAQEGGVWRLEGELTAAGGTAPVHLTITKLVAEPSGLVISAEGTVDRYAHGITAMKGMAARRLQVTLNARASRS